MATDYQIKQMHQAKIQRYDKSSEGAKFGGFMHDAVRLIVKEGKSFKQIENELVDIIKMLYRVEERVHFPEPIDTDKAVKMGNDWKERIQEEENLETITENQ